MEVNKTLSILAELYGTDKNVRTYTERYSLYLESFRELPIRILEVGIYTGASLKMWEAYFPNAQIVSVDINPDCKKYTSDRVSVHIGDQADVIFLESLISKYGNFDLIIDDGGHSWKQQIVTFNTLYPCLSNGGLFFIEDMHTSYRKNSVWSDYNITGIDYFKSLVDQVNLNGKSFCGYEEVGNQSLNYFENTIDYIHFYKSLVVVCKKDVSIQ